ncbi:uncharacterized protein LOC119515243 [Choloepus didactylus]|uniref:uncharacterized protein LOC119515243 n=1 Tax=Choloepus didactylus TaxID=27675 RepID=UPI00189EBB2F|nr:uncharacterized protein LOC119515243 [Choloepus didactylus]
MIESKEQVRESTSRLQDTEELRYLKGPTGKTSTLRSEVERECCQSGGPSTHAQHAHPPTRGTRAAGRWQRGFGAQGLTPLQSRFWCGPQGVGRVGAREDSVRGLLRIDRRRRRRHPDRQERGRQRAAAPARHVGARSEASPQGMWGKGASGLCQPPAQVQARLTWPFRVVGGEDGQHRLGPARPIPKPAASAASYRPRSAETTPPPAKICCCPGVGCLDNGRPFLFAAKLKINRWPNA